MNKKLVDYGIQNEDSDIRIHVCPVAKAIYLYDTKYGLDAINSGNFPERAVRTGNIITAKGFLVPPSKIFNCISIKIPNGYSRYFNANDSTSKKGDMAVRLVKHMILSKQIPLNLKVDEIRDEDMQISGIDIIVKAKIKIQVKCDYRGGEKSIGGTGNLFLQTKECNPFHQT